MKQQAINYAKALFDLHISEKCIEATSNIIAQNNALFEALSNPTIKKSEKQAVIDAVFEKEIRNFLKVLLDNSCFDSVHEVFVYYQDIVLDHKDIIKAQLLFVSEPDQEQIEKIKAFVRDKYNKADVCLELKEDRSLLGGFVLTVKDTQYDKSLQGTLASLSKNLVWR